MSRAGSARASRRDFIFLGSAEHSARSSRHVAGALLCLRGKRFESRENLLRQKLSGNMPDRAGNIPALPSLACRLRCLSASSTFHTK